MANTNACRSSNDNLVVGRGRVYLDLIINGMYQGERYIGNTPDFTVSSSVDKLDHYSSDHGFRTKDKSINIENSRSGSLTTDNISMENVALMFGGINLQRMQSAQTGVFERINQGNPVRRARQYALGVDADNPQGLGGIDPASVNIGYADASVSISDGTGDIGSIPGVKVLDPENYALDTATGMLWIEDTAPAIIGDVQLVITYDRLASSQEVIISGDDIVECALRFISDNPTGEQKNYYMPKVSISPDGDYALKGDDWQQLGFTFDVLVRDCETPPVIVYGNAKTTAAPVKTLSVQAAAASIPADNATTSTITAKVVDGTGAPVAGETVTFAVTGGTLTSQTGVTNAQGQVQTAVKGTAAGTATVVATLESTGVTKSTSVTLTAV